eukprot:Opistho-2@28915
MASQSQISFSSLPVEVVVCGIVPFVSEKDLASLASVNSRLRCVLKRVHLYTLRNEFGMQYCESAAFRNAVWADIPRERLVLNLEGARIDGDVSVLGGVHTLDLSYCDGVTHVSALGGVHSLNLRGCNGVRDVSALGGVHSLN